MSTLNDMQFSATELPNTKKLPYRNIKSTRSTELREVTPNQRGQAGGQWRSKPGHVKRERLKTRNAPGAIKTHPGDEHSVRPI